MCRRFRLEDSLQLLIKHRVVRARGFVAASEIGLTLAQVVINLGAATQVEGDRTIRFFQCQGWE